jgi:hypothetical protein
MRTYPHAFHGKPYRDLLHVIALPASPAAPFGIIPFMLFELSVPGKNRFRFDQCGDLLKAVSDAQAVFHQCSALGVGEAQAAGYPFAQDLVLGS